MCTLLSQGWENGHKAERAAAASRGWMDLADRGGGTPKSSPRQLPLRSVLRHQFCHPHSLRLFPLSLFLSVFLVVHLHQTKPDHGLRQPASLAAGPALTLLRRALLLLGKQRVLLVQNKHPR